MKTLFLLFFALNALAQDFVFDKEKGRAIPAYIGQIKILKGKAFRQNGEGSQELSIGDRLKKNDTVVTSSKSYVRILIVDDSVISLGPKSELSLVDFDFKDKKDRLLSFELKKGQLSGKIINKAKPGDITFKTRYTSMGVRGTYLLMNYVEKDQIGISEYALIEGKIQVTGSENKKIDLKQDQRLVLVHDASRKVSANEKMPLVIDPLDQVIDGEEFHFLPYFKQEKIPAGSPLLQVLGQREYETSSSGGDVSAKREKPRASWEQNLDKLNQKLRENQKKR